MKVTGSEILLDSSAWLSYFLKGDAKVSAFVDSKDYLPLTSVMSIFEVKRKLIIEKKNRETIESALKFIKANSFVVDLTTQICEKAAEESIKEKLHALDSLIYVTAKEFNAVLLTGDSDFKSKKNVILVK